MKYSLARFSVGAEHVKAARRALDTLVAAVHQHDPGVVYLVFQEPDQPVFFTLVSFEDEEHYRRHAASKHAARFARAILPLCHGRPSFVGLDLLGATRPSRTKLPASLDRARRTSLRLKSSRTRRN